MCSLGREEHCSVDLPDSRSTEWKKGDEVVHLRAFSTQETAKSASSRTRNCHLVGFEQEKERAVRREMTHLYFSL